MADYELTITRAEKNPFYKDPPKRSQYDHYNEPRDEREPHEREYETRRIVTAVLTEAEYVAIKRALIEHWAVAKDGRASESGAAPTSTAPEN